jgi:O-methyltransferase
MAKEFIKNVARLSGIELKRYDKTLDRYKSLYKKYKEYTMIPEEFFISNLELCNGFSSAEGDIVECGVWRGGMIAAIAELCGKNRTVHLFDSFEGLPPAKEIDGREALRWQADTKSPNYHDNCAADEIFAIAALKKANHKNYQLHKGWFQKTLPNHKGNQIAILRLDGDWYDSVKECLVNLFPLVAEGGAVIIDDYYTWDGCARAVHDYLSEIKSPSRVHQWNNLVAYILKKN